jgi:hypothetical protein
MLRASLADDDDVEIMAGQLATDERDLAAGNPLFSKPFQSLASNS